MLSELLRSTPVPDGGSDRFTCSVDGCNASFRRKEHLTRHFKTHNPETIFTCNVCSRKFNRSDSLARHLIRHGENFKAPSSRSKTACVACHAAKTKCDGERQCHACVKKGVECKYRSNEVDPLPQLNEGVGHLQVRDPEPSQDGSNMDFSHYQSSDSQSSNSTPHTTPEGFVECPPELQGSCELGIESLSNTAYLERYFADFHHRFPMIHRPSFDDQSKSTVLPLLLSSMEMMGAWLEGSQRGRDRAIAWHQEIMAQCIFEISKISSQDVFQQSLSASLCQGILINVIFTLYCGRPQFLSRGIILLNMLTAALREVGFFDPHTIWADDNPSFPLPFQLLKLGERQRLATSLYKIDAYLSIARGNAPMLVAEELIFPVPTSFSLWNATEAHVWEQRLANQPLYRIERSIYSMVHSTTDFTEMIKSHLLWEDVQISLCSVRPKLWRLHTLARGSTENPTELATSKAIIKRQLDSLKVQIDQMRLCSGIASHYYGPEDHSLPESSQIVKARSESLRYDTIFLYHLLTIHLYTDIPSLVNVLKDLGSDMSKYSEQQQHHIGNKRCSKAAWTGTPAARRSLCQALEILAEFQALDSKSPVEKDRLDPIAFVALSTAALVFWLHISFGMYACSVCAVGLGYARPEIIELGASGQLVAKEAWIEQSLMLGATVDGMEICSCNTAALIGRFRAFLPPDGQEFADSIAPGVFGRASNPKYSDCGN